MPCPSQPAKSSSARSPPGHAAFNHNPHPTYLLDRVAALHGAGTALLPAAARHDCRGGDEAGQNDRGEEEEGVDADEHGDEGAKRSEVCAERDVVWEEWSSLVKSD